jgi:quinol-cytochrome oxidoreductase complex cytochrome b subunit
MSPKLADNAVRQGDAIDSRYHPSAAVRRQLNKVFPTHWSFLLGEIALYSFIVLLITGSLLTADPISEHEALTEAAHASERKALTALREHQV